eukprot:CAMPEP_0174710488 /NCGR_PEP_ID=MMETSP1094-20130205/12114_1 /TAXON_ID=156173 /ORGANISM="Chrysochromulina brevifilum, Strain UTEX LB 985" /LENGTH=106 /DNA_ID=CAMNT_0015909303 /DNA_START=346 /DNA_END=663 /DNA_ORIENTATION=+
MQGRTRWSLLKESLDVSAYGADERGDIIPTLKHGDNRKMAIAQLAHRRRDPSEVVLVELDGGARVVFVCVKASAEEDRIGVEVAHRRQQHVLPNAPKLIRARAWQE